MFPGLQDSTPDPNSVLYNEKHMHSPTTSISNTERRSRSILNLEAPTLSPAHITNFYPILHNCPGKKPSPLWPLQPPFSPTTLQKCCLCWNQQRILTNVEIKKKW